MEKLRLHISLNKAATLFITIFMLFGFLASQAPGEVLELICGSDSAHTEWPMSDSETDTKDHKEEMDDKDEFENNDLNLSSSYYSNDLLTDFVLRIRSVDLPLFSPPPELV